MQQFIKVVKYAKVAANKGSSGPKLQAGNTDCRREKCQIDLSVPRFFVGKAGVLLQACQ